MCAKQNEKPAAAKIKLTHFVSAIFTLVIRKRSRNPAGDNNEDLKTIKEVARRIGNRCRAANNQLTAAAKHERRRLGNRHRAIERPRFG